MAKKVKRSAERVDSDKRLMIFAAGAVIIVAFLVGFIYKSPNVLMLPTPTPVSMVTVSLSPQNGSGESGTAVLSEINGKVMVRLGLVGEPQGGSQPVHIHLGSCPTPGAVKYPLTSVVTGSSSTLLDTTLAGLRAMGPLVINVHQSASHINTYVSCGDINF